MATMPAATCNWLGAYLLAFSTPEGALEIIPSSMTMEWA